MRRDHKSSSFFTPVLFIFTVSVLVLVLGAISFGNMSSSSSAIPKINISLHNTTASEINSDSLYDLKKYPNNSMSIEYNSKTAFYDNVTIKGHGNSTWLQEKKPYQIKFNQKTSLLGLAESKKYILLADFFDASHLRNHLALKLEEMLEQPFRLHGAYVNLYIDNQYQGLYYLTEKVEIGKNRIDLKDPLGILVEHEGLHAGLESECYKTITSVCLTVKDLVNDNLRQEAISSFLDQYIKLEIAAESYDYDKIKDLIDVDSFAKYYLLSNFTLNPDAYMSSYFFYQDGPNDKIHVGPGWDFDLAFNLYPKNTNYGLNLFSPYNSRVAQIFNNDKTASRIKDRAGIGNYGESESLVMYYLIHIPDFQNRVKELYQQYLYGHSTELLHYIDDTIYTIYESALLDNEKWGIGNFNENIETLKDWVRTRYDYLDSYYSDRSEIPDEFIFVL